MAGDNCTLFPSTRKDMNSPVKPSNLFQNLMDYTGDRKYAAHLWNETRDSENPALADEKFIEATFSLLGKKVKLDENGEIPFDDFIKAYPVHSKKITGLVDKLQKNVGKKAVSFETARETAKKFNSTSPFKSKLIATLVKDGDKYKVIIQERTKALEKQQLKTIVDKLTADKILARLQELGVKIEYVDSDRYKAKYTTSSDILNGSKALIQINQDYIDNAEVLAHEAGHFIVGVLDGEAGVSRILNYLRNNGEALLSLAKQMDIVDSKFMGMSKEQQVREVAGQFIGRSLLRGTAEVLGQSFEQIKDEEIGGSREENKNKAKEKSIKQTLTRLFNVVKNRIKTIFSKLSLKEIARMTDSSLKEAQSIIELSEEASELFYQSSFEELSSAKSLFEEERFSDAVAKKSTEQELIDQLVTHILPFLKETQSILSGVNTTITTKTGPRVTPVTVVKNSQYKRINLLIDSIQSYINGDITEEEFSVQKILTTLVDVIGQITNYQINMSNELPKIYKMLKDSADDKTIFYDKFIIIGQKIRLAKELSQRALVLSNVLNSASNVFRETFQEAVINYQKSLGETSETAYIYRDMESTPFHAEQPEQDLVKAPLSRLIKTLEETGRDLSNRTNQLSKEYQNLFLQYACDDQTIVIPARMMWNTGKKSDKNYVGPLKKSETVVYNSVADWIMNSGIVDLGSGEVGYEDCNWLEAYIFSAVDSGNPTIMFEDANFKQQRFGAINKTYMEISGPQAKLKERVDTFLKNMRKIYGKTITIKYELNGVQVERTLDLDYSLFMERHLEGKEVEIVDKDGNKKKISIKAGDVTGNFLMKYNMEKFFSERDAFIESIKQDYIQEFILDNGYVISSVEIPGQKTRTQQQVDAAFEMFKKTEDFGKLIGEWEEENTVADQTLRDGYTKEPNANYFNKEYHALKDKLGNEFEQLVDALMNYKLALDRNLPLYSAKFFRLPQYKDRNLTQLVANTTKGMNIFKKSGIYFRARFAAAFDRIHRTLRIDQYGTESMTDNDGISRIPLTGLRRLKTEEMQEISHNIFETLATYTAMCFNYASLIGSIDRVATTIIHEENKPKVHQDKAQKIRNNAAERLTAYFRANYYGETQYPIEFPGKAHDKNWINKQVSKLTSLAAFVFLGGNLHGGEVNSLNGLFNIAKEGLTGEYYSMKNLRKATQWYIKTIPSRFINLGNPVMFKHDIVSLIMARYNAVESFTNVQLGVRLTPLQKNIGIKERLANIGWGDLHYAPYVNGDYKMHALPFLALLDKTKVYQKGENGKEGKIMSLLDAYIEEANLNAFGESSKQINIVDPYSNEIEEEDGELGIKMPFLGLPEGKYFKLKTEAEGNVVSTEKDYKEIMSIIDILKKKYDRAEAAYRQNKNQKDKAFRYTDNPVGLNENGEEEPLLTQEQLDKIRNYYGLGKNVLSDNKAKTVYRIINALETKADKYLFGELEEADIAIKAKEVCNRMHGVMNEIDAPRAKRYFLTRALFGLKNYAVGLIEDRTVTATYNYGLKQMDEGLLSTQLIRFAWLFTGVKHRELVRDAEGNEKFETKVDMSFSKRLFLILWSEILPEVGRKNLNKALSAAGFSEKQIANTHKNFWHMMFGTLGKILGLFMLKYKMKKDEERKANEEEEKVDRFLGLLYYILYRVSQEQLAYSITGNVYSWALTKAFFSNEHHHRKSMFGSKEGTLAYTMQEFNSLVNLTPAAISAILRLYTIFSNGVETAIAELKMRNMDEIDKHILKHGTDIPFRNEKGEVKRSTKDLEAYSEDKKSLKAGKYKRLYYQKNDKYRIAPVGTSRFTRDILTIIPYAKSMYVFNNPWEAALRFDFGRGATLRK